MTFLVYTKDGKFMARMPEVARENFFYNILYIK